MTQNSKAADVVLADTVDLAGQRGIPEVELFAASLPNEDDRSLMLLAVDGVDARPLAGWLHARGPDTPLQTGDLDGATVHPGATLRWNRVVGVLECGRLLDPDIVDAVAALLARPAGSYVLVAVGAERLASREELDLVRRGLWRVLFAEPGVEWTGQDIGEYGCLLWSERPTTEMAVADVAGLVARDVDRLARWVDGEIVPGALAAQRAAHAVELLDRGLADMRASGPRKPGAAGATGVRRQRDAVATLRDRLLSRLDADAQTVELQVGASLQACEQQLRNGIGKHLGTLKLEALSGQPLHSEVASYLNDGLRQWRREAENLVEARLNRDATQADDLLETVDWDVVNDVVPGGGYPARLADRLAPGRREGVPVPGTLRGPAAPTAGGPLLTPSMRSLAYGGLAAAVSVAAIGPLWLPVTAISAAAAAGGSTVDRRISQANALRSAETWAKAVISATIDDLARSVRQSLRASRDPIRRSVNAVFTELTVALSGALSATSPSADPPPSVDHNDGDRAAVAALYAALAADVSPIQP